jgi:hypothetical protein
VKKMELASGSALDYPSSERVMEYLDKLSPDSEFRHLLGRGARVGAGRRGPVVKGVPV